MCGIAGYITIEKYSNSLFEKNAIELKKIMKNRGPDQQGFFRKSRKNYSVNFFFSRLSIIDLDERSNQPFYSDNHVLVFNGEIYNYLEIRKILESKGIKFKTHSDTEVLIKSYQFWGKNCTKYFDGMWSFAIFDYLKEEVFISRDNFGEKPLYYFFDQKNLVFGSEIKFIQNLIPHKDIKEINYGKINDYLTKGYKSLNKNNSSFYKNINQLESGTNLTINLNKFKISKEKYLIKSDLINQKISNDKNDNIYEIKKLLIQSMKYRLRSDVPISFCLSGGIDSSSLVSLSCKHFNLKPKCYSIIDSDKRYNEKKLIQKIKKDIDCEVEYINLKKEKNEFFFDNLDKLINYHDAPISTISYYIHSKISCKARKDNYKVIFSGTGADEIFTGYYDHFLLYLNEIKKNTNYDNELKLWKKNIKPFIRNINLKDAELFHKNPNFRNHIFFEKEFINQFYKKDINFNFTEKKYSSNILKNRLLNELFHESVPTILKEDDLNSMMNSIENRSPFLCKKLVSYALSIKNKNYIEKAYSKNILREAMKGILHEDIRLERKKIGFNSNIKSITSLNGKILSEFLSESSYIRDIVDLNKIKKLDFSKEISNNLSKFLFSLINVKLFLK
jgi:asparagine synthase (glutamine-hydrolysing)